MVRAWARGPAEALYGCRADKQVFLEPRATKDAPTDVVHQLIWEGKRSVNIRLSTGKIAHVTLPMPTPEATQEHPSVLHWLTQR